MDTPARKGSSRTGVALGDRGGEMRSTRRCAAHLYVRERPSPGPSRHVNPPDRWPAHSKPRGSALARQLAASAAAAGPTQRGRCGRGGGVLTCPGVGQRLWKERGRCESFKSRGPPAKTPADVATALARRAQAEWRPRNCRRRASNPGQPRAGAAVTWHPPSDRALRVPAAPRAPPRPFEGGGGIARPPATTVRRARPWDPWTTACWSTGDRDGTVRDKRARFPLPLGTRSREAPAPHVRGRGRGSTR
eukprot:scaffold427_cov344-Prasinococcus_capsulatus_cf.AAC.4